jgi:hypothetical protein
LSAVVAVLLVERRRLAPLRFAELLRVDALLRVVELLRAVVFRDPLLLLDPLVLLAWGISPPSSKPGCRSWLSHPRAFRATRCVNQWSTVRA